MSALCWRSASLALEHFALAAGQAIAGPGAPLEPDKVAHSRSNARQTDAGARH